MIHLLNNQTLKFIFSINFNETTDAYVLVGPVDLPYELTECEHFNTGGLNLRNETKDPRRKPRQSLERVQDFVCMCIFIL